MSAFAFAGINADSIWYDEYLALFYAGAMAEDPSAPLEIANRIVANESGQAPFYYILLSAWGSLAGWSVFAARMLSLLAGVLAVAWVYRLAADMYTTFAGFCSAAIVVGSAFFNVYLHEIRVYSLLGLEVVILLWLYTSVLKNRRYWPRSLALMIAATVALYSHPFMALLLAAIGSYHLILARRRASWAHTLRLLLFAGMLFVPWAWITLGALPETAIKDSEDLVRSNLQILLELAPAISNGLPLFLLLPLVSLSCAGRDGNMRMLWFVASAFLVAMLLVNSAFQTVNQVRYFMPVLPVLFVLGGISCAVVRRYRRFVFVMVVVWCIAGFMLAQSFGKTLYIREESAIFHIGFPFKEMVSDIKGDGGAGDAVVFEFPHHSWALQGVLDYYMRGSGMRYILADTLRAEGDWQPTLTYFERFISDAGRLYFVLDRSIEATAFVPEYERILGERFGHCERLWDTEQVKVDKYASSEALCQSPG